MWPLRGRTRNNDVTKERDKAKDLVSAQDGISLPAARSDQRPPASSGEGGTSTGMALFWRESAYIIGSFLGGTVYGIRLTTFGLALIGVAIWLRISYTQWIRTPEFLGLLALAGIQIVMGAIVQILDSQNNGQNH
jgi:predicted phage tail protein